MIEQKICWLVSRYLSISKQTMLSCRLHMPQHASVPNLLNTNQATLFLPSEATITQAISDSVLTLPRCNDITNISSYRLLPGIHTTEYLEMHIPLILQFISCLHSTGISYTFKLVVTQSRYSLPDDWSLSERNII